MEIISIQQLVSSERSEEKVRGCGVLAGDLMPEVRWQKQGILGIKEIIKQEKQKAEDEKRKKIETFNNSRIRLENLEDLQSIVRGRREKKPRIAKKEPVPSKPEPQETTEPVDVPEFLKSALEGRVLLVDKYLSDGGNPNVHDQFLCTALHRACLRGNQQIVENLLDAGATLESRDMLGGTPLHWACRGGQLEIIKLLLSRGAKIYRKDKLWSTALHVAVRTGHCDCVEHLIGCGANINAQDKEGDTPMHDAIRLGRFKAMQMLLMYGANLSIRNEEGLTPVEMVRDWQTGIREILQSCADRWHSNPRN
ncbi:ankyrin repeat domain-containing protein 23 isoform X2 [Rhinatrema bivittatum]|uniref:ankyrin repeat domain-containing protein 23 isoform X2 n=1 Tax=Rhinatrema bivittatum TaxID=194408 RepID=UPI00112D76C7|nr:ankyrin repeat domain-containing protein 23 isoform X2 [Rhinatrema bivittatum]